MKTIEQIKEELIKTGRCTNIPWIYKETIWGFMKTEFKGKSIQIGNLMCSEEFGCCASVGSSSIECFMTPKDYELYLCCV